MPNHKEHCADSKKRYGRSFSELHKWMDEISQILGSRHRRHRHDPNVTPTEAKAIFGENVDNACLDHIRLDEVESRKGSAEVRAAPIKFTIQTPNGIWHSESQVVTVLKESKIEVLTHSTRFSRHYVLKQVATEATEENEDEAEDLSDDEYEKDPDNPEESEP